MTTLHDTLAERGLLQDSTPGAAERLAAGPITGYVGFDPTADSLHAGSLIPVVALAWLQRTGGRPIVLLGGGTGMVGDPSGKRAERPVMSLEQIDRNARALEKQLSRFLRFDGPNAAVMLDNATWLRELRLMDFLRDTGRHFTVNYMLQKEAVKSRMDTGISFTEFSYMLIQAYDFWELFRTRQCELQMGGSDQWGNITAGIELIARREQKSAHGLVLPLLTTASGGKFGKSESGNIWLDPERTNSFEFAQFWLNTEDADVERFLKFFTFLPLDEIEQVVLSHRADPGKRIGQAHLSDRVTALVHGEQEAAQVRKGAAILFGGGAHGTSGGSSPELEVLDSLEFLATTVPNYKIRRDALLQGLPVAEVLVTARLASSKNEARRGIKSGGYSVNRVLLTDPLGSITYTDVQLGRYILLRKGKKTYAMLVVED